MPGGVYNVTVAWRYPNDDLVQFVGPVPQQRAIDPGRVAPVELGSLDFDYQITPATRGYRPPWTPIQVFHDGQKTYIQFSDDQAAPALFVSGPSGTELVNYRVRHNFYIVDKVIEHAELRLGHGQRNVVTVRRGTPQPTRSHSRDWYDD